MSVVVSRRNESRFEVLIFSETLHDMLIDLMQRNFGIKNVDDFVRSQYAHGKLKLEDFAYYRWQMQKRKENINFYASLVTGNIRAANALYPTSVHEYEVRRDYQNSAIVNCELIIKELQRVVDMFKVDVNLFDQHVKAIKREIDLIKRWRQSDNKIKSYIQG